MSFISNGPTKLRQTARREQRGAHHVFLFPISNAVAVDSMTGRVYASSGSIFVYDGAGFTGFRNPSPAPLASVNLGMQPSGLAVDRNTNRIYAAMIMTGAPLAAYNNGVASANLTVAPGDSVQLTKAT